MPRILSSFSKSGVIHDDRYRIILSLRRSTKGVRFGEAFRHAMHSLPPSLSSFPVP